MTWVWEGPEGPVRPETATREQLLEVVADLMRELESSREHTRRAFGIVHMYQRARR